MQRDGAVDRAAFRAEITPPPDRVRAAGHRRIRTAWLLCTSRLDRAPDRAAAGLLHRIRRLHASASGDDDLEGAGRPCAARWRR